MPDSELQQICDDFIPIVQSVHDVVEVPNLYKHIMRDFYASVPHRLIPRLSVTMKSHKPVGNVKLRPIHSSVSHPFAGAMRFLARELQTSISHAAHIIRDSDDMIHNIRSIRVRHDDEICKGDIPEFFMSG